MTAALAHYSPKPLKSVFSKAQSPQPNMKPKGLWLSVEDGYGWLDWREAEQWGLNGDEFVYEVELTPTAKVLRLGSVIDIDRFHKKYRASVFPGDHRFRDYFHINWQRVAKDYDGIIIAPYQWQRRLSNDVSWYYAWDCSSGCIWNAAAVASFALMVPDKCDRLRSIAKERAA